MELGKKIEHIALTHGKSRGQFTTGQLIIKATDWSGKAFKSRGLGHYGGVMGDWLQLRINNDAQLCKKLMVDGELPYGLTYYERSDTFIVDGRVGEKAVRTIFNLCGLDFIVYYGKSELARYIEVHVLEVAQ